MIGQLRRLLPLLRKMDAILFISFLLYSMAFLVLISSLNELNWQQSFRTFQEKYLEKNAYLLIDDLQEDQIAGGPLSPQQARWLSRRAALYGLLLHFESANRQEVWFDSFAKANLPVSSAALEVPYTFGGEVRGYLRLAYILEGNELEPSYVDFKETADRRAKTLLVLILLASVAFSYAIARRLSRPLNRVYTLAKEIGTGNREVNIPLTGPEEVRKFAATLNEMSRELKRQEDWRHHLMEDITHELRTPLTSLLTQIEAIVDGIYEPDPERMQEIYEELTRLTHLVNDLERLSEAESAQFTMNVRRTDMVELARIVHANFLPLARSKSIKLTFIPAYVPCFAEVDGDKIVQVLSNIVMNAIKYTSEGGRITLSVNWSGAATIFVCEDTGVGIHRKDLPYIFNRLYRADKSRSRFSGGVGLGLSIAKALVEVHGGILSATSELGVGSRFTVELPNSAKPYAAVRPR